MDNIVGKKLDGRYEIQEIIGVGGMAVVYKAYDCIDDRIVAVKVLKEEYLKNEEFRRRFKNESKAVSVLSHPNIVKVYDVSFGDRMQYIVMEYIDGITLKEYIDQQKVLTWNEAVHFTVQILRALSHAHERGIVHRDIKPQNIMMLEDGTIKVTDFGIARFAESETRTMTDKAIGSVHYISPEQARGGKTDSKSDIYSVGVMLYEMLTGKLPFEADSAVSVAIMQMQQTPEMPRALNPNIPEGLEEITLRAMQKDPEQRYRSASEMLDDIERFKNNPSARFQYKYFIDESPTKYVNAIHDIKSSNDYDKDIISSSSKSKVGKNGKNKKSNFLPILAGATAVLVLLVVGMIVIVLALKGTFRHTNSVTMPNLVGMQLKDAQEKYTDIEIIQNNTTYDDKAPAGQILKQSIAPGTPVKANSEVKVTVSLGAQKIVIPDVSGMEKDKAKETLESSGFSNITEESQYDEAAVGTVVGTNPESGQSAAANDTITLIISLGPKVTNVTVPDVTRMTKEQATRAIQDAGFVVGIISEESSDTVDKGCVTRQTPAAYTSATSKSTVDIWVSNGKQQSAFARVPGVENRPQSEAIDEIRKAGLVPNITGSEYSESVEKGCVISQDIPEGTNVKLKSKVNLVISRGPKPNNPGDGDIADEE